MVTTNKANLYLYTNQTRKKRGKVLQNPRGEMMNAWPQSSRALGESGGLWNANSPSIYKGDKTLEREQVGWLGIKEI